jgi:hypothetical protein
MEQTIEQQKQRALNLLETNHALLEDRKEEWRVYFMPRYAIISDSIIKSLVGDGLVELRTDGKMAWLTGKRDSHGLFQYLRERAYQ